VDSMKKSKLVLIGNGMAGVRTVEELLKVAPDLYDITVFGSEPYPNYNRILLSPVLAGEQTLDEIVLNTYEWYAENNITLHAGKTVASVDRVKRIVKASDGTEAEYDRLLICTGSNPFILPLPGKDLEGVIAYRDIADTNAMIDAATKYKHAVVIGGRQRPDAARHDRERGARHAHADGAPARQRSRRPAAKITRRTRPELHHGRPDPRDGGRQRGWQEWPREVGQIQRRHRSAG
jgi:hypothetical protein